MLEEDAVAGRSRGRSRCLPMLPAKPMLGPTAATRGHLIGAPCGDERCAVSADLGPQMGPVEGGREATVSFITALIALMTGAALLLLRFNRVR